jgi:hypothetical protein
MKRLVMVLAAAVLVFSASLSDAAKKEIQDAEVIKSESKKGFEEILDLWRDGNYGELYERTLIGGTETKESFARRMAKAYLKPSCCWEKMQDVSVIVKGPSSVVLRARLGLDAPGEMEYKTKSFKLYREDGIWRIAKTEIFALAEAKKPKKAHRSRVHH